MNEIRLPKLPDRTTVKLTIAVSPDLKSALDAYAKFYTATYQEEEAVVDLIPAMLTQFLSSDRGFARSRGQKRE
ncbi:transposase [Sphingopyxis sp. Root214]|uniref:DUF2274 domain-containing protein n=1 Tax=unclassified Sphingopyxis TaxID=2614943 RepID=UPI0006F7215A|nr:MULTISPECIES: DUF2274 domain-containing protein [unclassified Sphingopyxis]KQZ76567.1 transposase [Sphingopyxis sp. Root154]KRC09546.1 transposase [Sphingopyxis sp. Root214]